MSVEPPTLLSFVLCTDGSAQATFADRTVVLLNKGAGAFALVRPDGTETRQLTATCTSAHVPKVRLALHVRNTLTATAPRLCWELLSQPRVDYFESANAVIRNARWPEAAAPAHVLRHADGAVRVLSLDGLAWLLLHPRKHTYAACFPSPVDDSEYAELKR